MGKYILGIIHDEVKKDKVKKLCSDLNISYRGIEFSEINEPLGTLISRGSGSLPERKDKKMAPALFGPREIIIFSGIGDEELDVFLDEYKSRGIPPILLKGIITPFNMCWSVYELMEEYEKEAKNL